MNTEIRWPTVALVAVLVAGVVALAKLNIDPALLAAFGAFSVVVAGAMRRMYRPGDSTKTPPGDATKIAKVPPPLPVLLVALAFALVVIGCASTATKRATANGGYLGQQLDCIDKAKTDDDATACRGGVKRDWDGGAK